MSAYIVDKKHILYLIAAAQSRRILRYGSLSWWTASEAGPDGSRQTLSLSADPIRLAEVGTMLWQENVKSVSARYPGETPATLPGPARRDVNFVIAPGDLTPVYWDEINPVQVLMSCDCYEYQSCEHEGWRASEAYSFIQSLRCAAWHALPGYDDCEWGAPETAAERSARLRAEHAAKAAAAGKPTPFDLSSFKLNPNLN